MFSSHSAKTWEPPYDKHMNAILMTKPGFCHRPRRLFDGTCLEQSLSFRSHSKIIVSRKAPHIFKSLVGMILGGSNIQTQTNNLFEIQAVFSVAQCIFDNSTYRHRKQATGTYHNTMREPPLPIYVELLLHGETRKRSLVDKFYDLGLWVSYDRVLSISADLGNDISELYKSEGVVYPRQLWHGVFTTAACDNIDHNPSWNTALGNLYRTTITLFQHPCHTNLGEARIIESHVSSSHQEKRHFQKSTQNCSTTGSAQE